MKKVIKNTLLILLLIFNLHAARGQSGWVKNKNEGYFQLSHQLFYAKEYHNLQGEKLETNQFQQQSTQLYAEYGITERLTMIAYFPILTSNRFETTEWVSGIGDLRLSAKYAILQKSIPLSIIISPEIPTGPANNRSQSQQNNFESINLPSGDGEFNLWSTLAASRSFQKISSYTSIFLSYNYRTSYEDVSFSNQLLLGVEWGYQIADLIWINAKLQALKSLNAPEQITDFVRGDGTSYSSYSFGFSLPVYKKFNFTANYQNFNDWVFERKNIYSSGVFNFGISYDLKPEKE